MNIMEVNNGKSNVEMGSKRGLDWTELTWECLIEIFLRLSIEQRWVAVMLVCKRWMNVCKDPLLNLVFDLESWFMSSSETKNWWTSEFAEKVDKVLMSVVDQSEGCLKEIRVRHCTDRSLLYVADRCPNLDVLWVKHSQVTVKSMNNIALKCVKIKEVDISHSYDISRMIMLGRNCKNLQIMKLNFMAPSEVSKFEHPKNHIENRCPLPFPFEDVDAFVIRKYMPQLKHLELRYSTMTKKGLAFLCKNCPNLEYLDLFGSCLLTSEGVTKHISSLKNLKEIKKP